MEADTATRYRSRILREMNANRENPFNSPPSSTGGSHRAASPTLSSVFSDPEGESTRRLSEDIARVTAPRKLPVNWEAAHRKWPEYYSLPKKNERPIFDEDNTDTQPLDASSKENKPLVPTSAAPLIAKYIDDDTTQDAWSGSKRTRAEMQPRVDNESDLSSILSKSPPKGLSTNGVAKNLRVPSPLSTTHPDDPLPEAGSFKAKDRQGGSISEALERLRRASSSPKINPQQAHDESSPNMSSAKSSLTAVPPSPSTSSPDHDASNGRSFFMPDVTHLGDFVTGTLRFTGSVKNGVPILVKQGKVHDQKVRPFAARHAVVDGVVVPEDEEKIFVSMDMIRDEIISLQDHYDKIQEYAANLQCEVERLEAQLKSHKSFDGRFGMDRANEQILARKKELEIEVASLEARLDQANHRVSSGAIENDTLAQERDRAIARLQEACEDINKLTRKLSVKEKELETTSKQLGSSEQTRQENDTLRQDLASLQQARESTEAENKSLRTDNESLRKELKLVREEVESLRSDNNHLRTDQQSLLAENRSLRSSNKALMDDDDDFRENVDGLQHELDAAREEIESLRQELRTLGQEKSSLREDNDSLVRHNEKYFNENKILRRENSGFERSIHDLHDEIIKLKEEITLLKEQPDHCRPMTMTKEDLTAPMDEETEENMTSAFFVPDITMNSNETGATDNAETKASATAAELSGRSKDMTLATNDDEETRSRETGHRETGHSESRKREMSNAETRKAMKRDASGRGDKSETRSRSKTRSKAAVNKGSSHVPKVAFSIPEKTTRSSKANQGSKRKSASKPTLTDLDLFGDNDDTTGLLSVENSTQDQVISLNLTLESIGEAEESKSLPALEVLPIRTQKSQAKRAIEVKTSVQDVIRPVEKDSCPALSNNARRVLDSLSSHSCQNCIVCSRITSHSGVATLAEVAAGKKRVTVPRPVPVSDRQVQGDDPTVRPSVTPGHALALVIKGLEDESQHLQLELLRLQAQYNGSDKSQGRRQRLALAEAIRMILKRLEVKNDQIYSLYDVLEGQKAAGQAMSEEEMELTVLNITGMTVRDVTSGSDQGTWEGIVDG